MAESEKLYEQIKNFFLNEEKAEFVIEISDSPFVDWKIYRVNSIEEMMMVRANLIKKGTGLTGVINFEGHYNFYYGDNNFVKSQNLENGKVTDFSDFTV